MRVSTRVRRALATVSAAALLLTGTLGTASAANAAASTSSINPYLIGGLGLVALVSAGLLISRGLGRRKPRMIPARRTSSSRVRYR